MKIKDADLQIGDEFDVTFIAIEGRTNHGEICCVPKGAPRTHYNVLSSEAEVHNISRKPVVPRVGETWKCGDIEVRILYVDDDTVLCKYVHSFIKTTESLVLFQRHFCRST